LTFLITCATGNIGSRVVERLVERGERPRVLARDPAKARARHADRVDIAVGDLGDPASLSRALADVRAVFLVNSGPELDLRDALAARLARDAGVELIVKLSSLDAAQKVGTGAWHARGEDAIRSSGVAFTFVEPTGFMDNALFWSRSIIAAGVVRSSTGDGKIPFIHSDDIADVATEALVTRQHLGAALAITGPRALSYPEMTSHIGAAIKKPLRYEEISDEAAGRALGPHEQPAMIDAHLSIFRAIREGRLAEVTPTVEKVLGRPPRSFDQWIEENASAFH
jgi:uncharacterized protein YbjT (DUF2867 family)